MGNNGVPTVIMEHDTEVMDMSVDNVHGVIVDVVEDVPTRKVIVGRYAFNDKCRCGASCTIDDDGVPSLVIYDSRTFDLLACPACLPPPALIPLNQHPTRPGLRLVKG